MRLETRLHMLLILACAWPGLAIAEPLEPAECTTLSKEREALLAQGTKVDMERGPEWAKANLGTERLDKIKRLIAVEEQLSFRCNQLVTARPALLKPPEPDPQPASPSPQAGTAGANPVAPANPAAAAPGEAAPAAPPKKKKKTKQSDAYVPPPPSMTSAPHTSDAPDADSSPGEINLPSLGLTP